MDALVRIKRAILKGDYVFTRKAREEMVRDGLKELDVVEAIDGPILLNECVADLSTCTFSSDCPMHEVWCEAQKDLVDRLKGTTFDKFINGK